MWTRIRLPDSKFHWFPCLLRKSGKSNNFAHSQKTSCSKNKRRFFMIACWFFHKLLETKDISSPWLAWTFIIRFPLFLNSYLLTCLKIVSLVQIAQSPLLPKVSQSWHRKLKLNKKSRKNLLSKNRPRNQSKKSQKFQNSILTIVSSIFSTQFKSMLFRNARRSAVLSSFLRPVNSVIPSATTASTPNSPSNTSSYSRADPSSSRSSSSRSRRPVSLYSWKFFRGPFKRIKVEFYSQTLQLKIFSFFQPSN